MPYRNNDPAITQIAVNLDAIAKKCQFTHAIVRITRSHAEEYLRVRAACGVIENLCNISRVVAIEIADNMVFPFRLADCEILKHDARFNSALDYNKMALVSPVINLDAMFGLATNIRLRCGTGGIQWRFWSISPNEARTRSDTVEVHTPVFEWNIIEAIATGQPVRGLIEEMPYAVPK